MEKTIVRLLRAVQIFQDNFALEMFFSSFHFSLKENFALALETRKNLQVKKLNS
jgi:hypothetical protein